MRTEILLSGSGGQGLIMAGFLLAEAAVLFEGTNATHNQSYGPEARGGNCKSEVIISDGDINYANLMEPDVLLAMTQSSFDMYCPTVKANGLIIVDTSFVEVTTKLKTGAKVFSFPITEMAIEAVGNKLMANVTALGILVGLTRVVDIKSLKQEVATKAPPGTEEKNQMALICGFNSIGTVMA